MHGGFDEQALFTAIARSGARALLIGRRALVALGLPVLTADYDFWLHPDDIDAFNRALAEVDLAPNRSPEQARSVGRYVLENDDRIDVLVARQVSTRDGVALRFDDAWGRRQRVAYVAGIDLQIPSIDDLILTKRWSLRPKDVDDIELLEALKRGQGDT